MLPYICFRNPSSPDMSTEQKMTFSVLDWGRNRLTTAIIVALGLGAFVLVNWTNGRLWMADFKVYFDAAEMWLDGGSPYGRSYGLSSGYYKYAPIALAPFVLLQPLGFELARTLYLLFLFGSMVIWVPTVVDMVYRRLRFHQVQMSRPKVWAFAVFGVLTLQHLSRELLLGNVNWLLLIGILVWWARVAKPRHSNRHAVLSGLLLAVICIFKPHFAVLIPWLAWRRPRRYIIWTILWGLILLALPMLVVGPVANFELIYDWLGALVGHNSATVTSFNTLAGMLGLANSGAYAWVPLILALALLMMWIGRYYSVEPHDESLEVFVLVGILPNLVLTDTEHFMWSLPMVAWWAILLTNESFWKNIPSWDRWLTTLVFGVMMVPYCLASPDLWGEEIGSWLEHGGALGWSNLFIVLGGLWMHHVYLTSNTNED